MLSRRVAVPSGVEECSPLLYLVVIAAMILARAGDVGIAPRADAHPRAWAAPAAGALLACAAHWALCAVAGGRVDATGRVAWVNRAHAGVSAARLLALAALAYGVLGLGFDGWVRGRVGDLVVVDELLIVSPVLTTVVATWWTFYPLERRMREAALARLLMIGAPVHAPASRRAHVLGQARHQLLLLLLPLCVILGWNEVVERADAWLSGPAAAFVRSHREPVRWAGLLGAVALAPVLLRAAWDAVRLPPGELHDRITGVLRRHRVRVAGPLVWRTHGTLVNGAILGVFYPMRYLLLTDALLERLSQTQLVAVVAHEVAHVRRHHLPWLGASVLAAVAAGAWAVEAIALALPATLVERVWFVPAASLGLLCFALAVFGAISRRFEWQADAFAAVHLSDGAAAVTPDAADAVAGTLGEVASSNGVPTTARSWRHGSIALRQAKVRALAGLPVSRIPIDATVRRIKWATLVVIAIAVGAGVLSLIA